MQEDDLQNLPFVLSTAHAEECHSRWKGNRHYTQEMHDKLGQAPDHWSSNQCGKCRFFIPLTGAFAADYGVCSNASSPMDGRAMFEHDGCDYFSDAEVWVNGVIKNGEVDD